MFRIRIRIQNNNFGSGSGKMIRILIRICFTALFLCPFRYRYFGANNKIDSLFLLCINYKSFLYKLLAFRSSGVGTIRQLLLNDVVRTLQVSAQPPSL